MRMFHTERQKATNEWLKANNFQLIENFGDNVVWGRYIRFDTKYIIGINPDGTFTIHKLVSIDISEIQNESS